MLSPLIGVAYRPLSCMVIEPGLNAFDKGRACATAENSARGAGNLMHHRVLLSVYGCAKAERSRQQIRMRMQIF